MRWFLALLFILVASLVGGNYYLTNRPDVIQYEKGTVQRADVIEVVAVTGYAEPIEVQVVQSQTVGIVAKVHVDFNDEVRKDQVLATLSSELEQMQLDQANSVLEGARLAVKVTGAGIEAANAGVQAADADLSSARSQVAKLENLGRDVPGKDLESARSNVEKASAGVALAQSRLQQGLLAKEQAESQIKTALLGVDAAKLKMSKTELKSPMNGFILNRNIQVGDTVGTPRLSLTESSHALFEVAAPLHRMRAIVKVSESDYGRVQVGQSACFTVDAFPDEKFTGTVKRIRSTPTTDRTSVSYATELEFDNRKDSAGRWMVLPRFTVSADIMIRQVKDALVVPNAALLYTPRTNPQAIPPTKEGEAIVWVRGNDSRPTPRVIVKGISDGAVTQVVAGDLQLNDEVITGEPTAKADEGLKLPFAN